TELDNRLTPDQHLPVQVQFARRHVRLEFVCHLPFVRHLLAPLPTRTSPTWPAAIHQWTPAMARSPQAAWPRIRRLRRASAPTLFKIRDASGAFARPAAPARGGTAGRCRTCASRCRTRGTVSATAAAFPRTDRGSCDGSPSPAGRG